MEGLEGLLAVAQRVVKPVQELDPGFYVPINQVFPAQMTSGKFCTISVKNKKKNVKFFPDMYQIGNLCKYEAILAEIFWYSYDTYEYFV